MEPGAIGKRSRQSKTQRPKANPTQYLCHRSEKSETWIWNTSCFRLKQIFSTHTMSESFTFGQKCFESPSLTKSTENDQQKRVQKDPTTIIWPSQLLLNQKTGVRRKTVSPLLAVDASSTEFKTERASYRRSMRRRRSVTCSVVFWRKNRDRLIIKENLK